MKYTYLLGLLSIFSSSSAQTVKSKKEVIFIDEKPALSYVKKSMGNEIHIFKINTTEEIFSMFTETNGTESKVDDAKKIVFNTENTVVKSVLFRERNWDAMVLMLLQERVIDVNGLINKDALLKFAAKFDEKNVNHINKY